MITSDVVKVICNKNRKIGFQNSAYIRVRVHSSTMTNILFLERKIEARQVLCWKLKRKNYCCLFCGTRLWFLLNGIALRVQILCLFIPCFPAFFDLLALLRDYAWSKGPRNITLKNGPTLGLVELCCIHQNLVFNQSGGLIYTVVVVAYKKWLTWPEALTAAMALFYFYRGR